MKKFMLGCLITGLLLLAAIGGAAYWFIWRPNQQAQQAEMNARAFTPNAQGLLTKTQVDNYLAVQNAMFAKLGADFERIKKKYAEKAQQPSSGGSEVGVGDMMVMYQEFNALKNSAKEAKTQSLNAQKISIEEYTWIREQVNTSMKVLATGALDDLQKNINVEGLNIPLPSGDATSQGAEQDATQKLLQEAMGMANDALKQKSSVGPEMSEAQLAAAKKNAELLKPHYPELLKMSFLAFIDGDQSLDFLLKP
jgi:hypothetical protein